MRALLLLSLLVAGCGQSGDLYLPPTEPAPAEAPPSAPEPPAEEKKEKQ